MANLIYNKFLQLNASGQLDLDAAGTVLRVLLERSTSTYAPNKDHDFLDSFTTGGGIEITVASYSRKTLANKAVNLDDPNDRAEFDFDDVAFGALESGQTVNGIIIYQQIGGDDLTPADDPLICRIDTATGLPLILNGQAVTITINVEGLLQISQP
jgi:hypothetical protein